MTALPTAPVPLVTSTVPPGRKPATSSARAAVRNVVGIVAAASSDSMSGIFTTMSRAGVRATNSAQTPWTLNPLPAKATRVPSGHSGTFERAMTPAPSIPAMAFCFTSPGKAPPISSRSNGWTQEAVTRTRICPAPSGG